MFKIGGAVVESPELLDRFCRDFAAVKGPKVLVHGGGVKASALQERLGMVPLKIEGRRVTDADTLEVVTMVYAGLCSKNVVARLQSYGCNAIGLSGCDANVITASRRPPIQVGDSTVDFGFVGDVRPESVNALALKGFLEMGLVPVLNAINHDGRGRLLNTNADTVASCTAAALGAELVCCFELDGVLEDIHRPGSVIPVIDGAAFARMKAEGTVSDGMIPKIAAAFEALKSGAVKVTIRNSSRILEDGGTEIRL